jgi:hypothetical protein
MSDEVWTAAITGAVGISANMTTYLVSRRSAKTAARAAEKQAEVELAKVTADNERLREQVREAERSNRQGTYHRMLAVISRMDLFGTGGHPDDESDYKAALDEYNTLAGGVRLFGAEAVRNALDNMTLEMDRLAENIAARQRELGESYGVAFSAAWGEWRPAFLLCEGLLTDAMRDDVTRDILGPSGAPAITCPRDDDSV